MTLQEVAFPSEAEGGRPGKGEPWGVLVQTVALLLGGSRAYSGVGHQTDHEGAWGASCQVVGVAFLAVVPS